MYNDTRLNPCSCGGWSQSRSSKCPELLPLAVLILVLVEDGLRDSDNRCAVVILGDVLILVLVEDGLRGIITACKSNMKNAS